MGNEYGWRKERLRAEVLRRFWRTSIFITCSTCGSKCGVKSAHGDVIVVRFADDIVVGFQSKADAEQFRAELTERMRKFHLELHPEKTRLLELDRKSTRLNSSHVAISYAV